MAKKKRQKSKAALATQAKRAEREAAPGGGSGGDAGDGEVEAVEFKGGGGGLLSGMRTGFKAAVGTGEQTQKKKGGWLGTLIFLAIVAGLTAFIFGTAR